MDDLEYAVSRDISSLALSSSVLFDNVEFLKRDFQAIENVYCTIQSEVLIVASERGIGMWIKTSQIEVTWKAVVRQALL